MFGFRVSAIVRVLAAVLFLILHAATASAAIDSGFVRDTIDGRDDRYDGTTSGTQLLVRGSISVADTEGGVGGVTILDPSVYSITSNSEVGTDILTLQGDGQMVEDARTEAELGPVLETPLAPESGKSVLIFGEIFVYASDNTLADVLTGVFVLNGGNLTITAAE